MRASVNGTKLFYDVDGMGLATEGERMVPRPQVLVLHGGPGMDHSLLKPLFAPLTDAAQVIWLDLRGHGRSEASDPAAWRLAQCAEDVLAFCETLELHRPVLAGASVGGTAAALAATRHPDAFAGVILTSTPVGPRLAAMREVFERLTSTSVAGLAQRYWEDPADAKLAADYRRECLPLYSRDPLDPAVTARAVMRPELAAAFYAGAEWRALDLCEIVPGLRCPALVISGEDDPVAPLSAARELVHAMPSGLGELIEVEHGRHVLFQDDPDLLRAAARRFIADLAVGTVADRAP